MCVHFFDWPARNPFSFYRHIFTCWTFSSLIFKSLLDKIIPGSCGFTVVFRLPDFFWDLAKVTNKNSRFESLQCYSTSLNMLLMIKLVPKLYQKVKSFRGFFHCYTQVTENSCHQLNTPFLGKLWKQRNFQKWTWTSKHAKMFHKQHICTSASPHSSICLFWSGPLYVSFLVFRGTVHSWWCWNRTGQPDKLHPQFYNSTQKGWEPAWRYRVAASPAFV